MHVPAAASHAPVLAAHADWQATVGQLLAPWLPCRAAVRPTLLPLVPTLLTASRELEEDVVLLLGNDEHLHIAHVRFTFGGHISNTQNMPPAACIGQFGGFNTWAAGHGCWAGNAHCV